jgi:hypothetical protein
VISCISSVLFGYDIKLLTSCHSHVCVIERAFRRSNSKFLPSSYTISHGNAPPGSPSRSDQCLVETLGFRHIGVVHDEYAVSPDGMKIFGVLDLATEMHACLRDRCRNSHDKSMRLAMTVGVRVFVCSNMAFSGDFTPVTMSPKSARRSGRSSRLADGGQYRYSSARSRSAELWRG